MYCLAFKSLECQLSQNRQYNSEHANHLYECVHVCACVCERIIIFAANINISHIHLVTAALSKKFSDSISLPCSAGCDSPSSARLVSAALSVITFSQMVHGIDPQLILCVCIFAGVPQSGIYQTGGIGGRRGREN